MRIKNKKTGGIVDVPQGMEDQMKQHLSQGGDPMKLLSNKSKKVKLNGKEIKSRQKGGQVNEQDQMQQLIQMAAQALSQGAPPEEVVQMLVQKGVPQEIVQQVMQAAMQGMQQEQQAPQEQQMEMSHGGALNSIKAPYIYPYQYGGQSPVNMTSANPFFQKAGFYFNQAFKDFSINPSMQTPQNQGLVGSKFGGKMQDGGGVDQNWEGKGWAPAAGGLSMGLGALKTGQGLASNIGSSFLEEENQRMLAERERQNMWNQASITPPTSSDGWGGMYGDSYVKTGKHGTSIKRGDISKYYENFPKNQHSVEYESGENVYIPPAQNGVGVSDKVVGGVEHGDVNSNSATGEGISAAIPQGGLVFSTTNKTKEMIGYGKDGKFQFKDIPSKKTWAQVTDPYLTTAYKESEFPTKYSDAAKQVTALLSEPILKENHLLSEAKKVNGDYGQAQKKEAIQSILQSNQQPMAQYGAQIPDDMNYYDTGKMFMGNGGKFLPKAQNSIKVYQGGNTKTPTGESNAFNYSGGAQGFYTDWLKQGVDITKLNNEREIQYATYDALNKTAEGRDLLRSMWKKFGNTKQGLNSPSLKNIKTDNLSDGELTSLREAYGDNFLGARSTFLNPNSLKTASVEQKPFNSSYTNTELEKLDVIPKPGDVPGVKKDGTTVDDGKDKRRFGHPSFGFNLPNAYNEDPSTSYDVNPHFQQPHLISPYINDIQRLQYTSNANLGTSGAELATRANLFGQGNTEYGKRYYDAAVYNAGVLNNTEAANSQAAYTAAVGNREMQKYEDEASQKARAAMQQQRILDQNPYIKMMADREHESRAFNLVGNTYDPNNVSIDFNPDGTPKKKKLGGRINTKRFKKKK